MLSFSVSAHEEKNLPDDIKLVRLRKLASLGRRLDRHAAFRNKDWHDHPDGWHKPVGKKGSFYRVIFRFKIHCISYDVISQFRPFVLTPLSFKID